MAETAIITVLTKLGELASREAAVLLRVGDDIVLLRDRLEWLQAFVHDADRKRRLGTDDILSRVWVSQTRNAAFQAEDALELFFHKVEFESRGYLGWKRWRRYVTGCITQITARHNLSAQIEGILEKLERISENRKEYKIEYIPSGTLTAAFTEFAPWYSLKRTYVGRYSLGDEDILKSQLLDDKGRPPRAFLSIVGESGIGKGTFMDEICNRVCEHFNILMWYNVPRNSSMEEDLYQIYIRVCEETERGSAHSPVEEGTDIAERIRSMLDEKRYLLVLSGVVSKSLLNCLSVILPDGENGSRVVFILDLDNADIAVHAKTINAAASTLQLSRLNKEESGELFRLRIFGKEESVGTEYQSERHRRNKVEAEKAAKSYEQDVFDITGGHPLAIVVLAGLLRSKDIRVEWGTVLENLKCGGSLLSREQPADRAMLQQRLPPIERIFSTSFDYLPDDLKSCFLYFAAFPKDLWHSVDRIVRMWIAEGFIKPHRDKTPEEVGHDYLEELASRCLVEVVNSQGEILKVGVHNRILVFLQSEAREASFIEVHDKNDVLAPASVRRLSIQHNCGSSCSIFNNKYPKLRSFICRVDEEPHRGGSAGMNRDPEMDNSGCCLTLPNSTKKYIICPPGLKFLAGSKFLRLISIQGLGIQELPEEIGDMIYLRYLYVACINLKELPSSIGRLLNLQTLDIRKTQIEQVHPNFWKIKALRHVLANNLMLPKSVINGPDELQTLHGVRASKEKWDEGSCPLDLLTKLRSLELHGFVADKHSQALTNALKKMQFLRNLKLKGDEIPSCVFTAPSLRCLHTLVLNGNVKWDQIPSNNVRMLRPNLVHLEASDIDNAPPPLKHELRDIIIE